MCKLYDEIKGKDVSVPGNEEISCMQIDFMEKICRQQKVGSMIKNEKWHYDNANNLTTIKNQ